jgi:small-conductance mechanosensitive channel
VILLYAFLPLKKARYYHYWLALPVFIIGLGTWFEGSSVPLQLLSQIELFTLFEDPVTVGELFWALMSLYLLFTITRAIQDLLQGVIVRRSRTEPEGVRAILSIGRYIVLALGLMVILAGIGFDMTALAVIGGGLSVGIGFGLQSIISNFISGIVLLFERSLRPGDVVEVGGIMGTVKKLDIRATTVRRFDNISMIIPNETLFTSTVTNYTQNDQVTRVMIDIGVSYDSDPSQVMDILRRTCREHPLVMDDPQPLIYFKEYGDSSLKFGLGVWLAKIDYLVLVPSELRTRIFAEFKQCGIEIPFPQRDLHIRSGLPLPQIETASGD